MKLLKRLFREEEGVTLIEYALIAALIAVVAIATIALVGEEVEAVFQNIVCLSQKKYPKGALDYDMSFDRKATPEEVDRWMQNIKEGALDTVDLPDFEAYVKHKKWT